MLTVSFAAGCNDGVDNDGDGLTDSAQDTGCVDANDGWETDVAQACDDGIDNDLDAPSTIPVI